ncbi:MAG: N-acetylmuramidase family protein [Muribaculaceae bacterium]|nr:N-acetylmuramidase family protein [Muribaculaceae bacterium]
MRGAKIASILAATALLLGFFSAWGERKGKANSSETGSAPSEMVRTTLDSLPKSDSKTRYTSLTDADFRRVAQRLGVEVAAIKAVVVIEAGEKMEGFWAPGVPVVNFDRTMYNRYRAKAKNSKGNPSEKVPSGLKGYPLSEWTQLVTARKTNVDGANMGTFWGMFQIGGFNYRLCGCQTVGEMVRLMSYSELEQLELFATFLINTGMVADLKKKNWAAFAKKYNGPNYARRGYHTKMANAYARFKK